MFNIKKKKQVVKSLRLLALSLPLSLPAQEARTRFIPKNTSNLESQTHSKSLTKADYANAFEKLVKLGLPDAKGAKYINLKFAQKKSQDEDYYYNRYNIKRDGNAWLLPIQDKETGAFTVIHDGFHLSKVASKEKRSLFIRLLAGSDDKARGGLQKAEWSEIDATKEVDKIIEQLTEKQNLRQIFDGDTWAYDPSAISELGKLLMMACHLHRAGHLEAGNKLAHYILSNAPYPFKVIDHVVGELASSDYKTLINQLFADQQWEDFLKGIRALSTKYPRGWDDQVGLKILIPKVAAHLRSGQPKLSPFKDQAIDPDIVAALEEIMTPNESENHIELATPQSWLINADGEITNQYGYESSISEPITVITTRGLAALPTLIAASNDETLIAATFNDFGSDYENDFHHSIHGIQNVDSDQVVYDKMLRPCTRGEITRAILTQALPSNIEKWDSLSTAEFQLFAHEWWNKNRNKSPNELAITFLEDGDQGQQSTALQVLLNSGEESSFPLIEEHILSSRSLSNQIPTVSTYLKTRKTDGKQFHDIFIAKLREEFEQNYGDYETNSQIQRHYKQQISALAIFVNDTSPEEIMAQVSKGETTLNDALPLLQVSFKEGEALDKAESLLSFINNLKTSTDRLTALRSFQKWTYHYQENPSQDHGPSEQQQALRKLALSHLESWQKLLKRKDGLDLTSKVFSSFGSPPSEAHYAAMVMNALYYPETSYQLRQINDVTDPNESWDLLLSRMEELSKTKKAPIFPAAANVGEERKKAIHAKIKTLPAAEIIPYRASLNLSERLTVMEFIQGLEKLPENIAALAHICQKIHWERAHDLPLDLRDRIEKVIIGQELSTAMAESTFKILSQEEIGIILIFRTNDNSLNGPHIMAWSTKMSGDWLYGLLPEKLDKLNNKDTTRLEALITFGINPDSDTPETAVRFLAPIDAATEKSQFEELLKKSLALFTPSQEDEETDGQVSFALTTETFKNYTSIKTEEHSE